MVDVTGSGNARAEYHIARAAYHDINSCVAASLPVVPPDYDAWDVECEARWDRPHRILIEGPVNDAGMTVRCEMGRYVNLDTAMEHLPDIAREYPRASRVWIEAVR